LGGSPTISINCSDLAGIKDVLIECENSNNTMTNIGGNTWQYNSWIPLSIGNYTYIIFIIDINDNVNFVNSSIIFQDTVIPSYANMFENADPLELGDTQIIRIDVYDIAGINQTLIEIEGTNHSMINIYGNTWQYDSWTPSNWITYQYRIHMEDLSGNWNLFVANLTVQDTISPSPPVITNSPSGDVSGILVFDWNEGYDPSGISYFILIIDNETDPLTTPGFLFEYNITNIGPESSYFEFSEHLAAGRYYYFLAQIDGLGHQSTYTMGTFNVITPASPNSNFLIYLILGIIGASVAGLIATATIVRKRTKKEMLPQRKKVPFKVIISHIEQISNSQVFQDTEIKTTQQEELEPEELPDKQKMDKKINEYKNLGEELFSEGAYLEAQKQFMLARDLLLQLGRDEETKLLSDLITGINNLLEERDKRLELLENTKIAGDAVKIYENYHDVIEISKKLRDTDGVSMYKSELIEYFQLNGPKIKDLEDHRAYLEQYTELLLSNNEFKKAAQLYEKCENISQLFVQLDMDDEVANIEKFRVKKNDCLKRISE
ncbi:MAG: tetratricopeptide repeat protein, partial [Promethearchaeota archaeon]